MGCGSDVLVQIKNVKAVSGYHAVLSIIPSVRENGTTVTTRTSANNIDGVSSGKGPKGASYADVVRGKV